MKPQIKKVADVSHLINMRDEEKLIKRRDMMKKLFKAGIAVGLPAIILNSCSEDPLDSENDDNSDTGTGNPVEITGHRPSESNLDLTETDYTRIDISFDRLMDKDSVENAFSIEPLPPNFVQVAYQEDGNGVTSYVEVQSDNEYVWENALEPDTQYVVTLQDSAKDKEGNKIDGNNNGKAGGNYSFSFVTGKIDPPVVNETMPEGIAKLSSSGRLDISIRFSQLMDEESTKAAFSISPQPPEGYHVKYSDYTNALYLVQSTEESLVPIFDYSTEYTVTIKGTAKDVYGNLLDGNKDGVGGDDFSFSFTTEEYDEPCSCESYVCSCQDNTCGCQSDSCTCVGFHCPCQFAGCPADI